MNFEEAKYKAIKYIGISKKTEYEVITKLKRSDIDDNIISKVIDYLLEFKYLNDIDYVDSYIRQSERMLKYSLYEIIEKLKMKGIDSDITEDRLNKLMPDDYEEKIVRKILDTKSKTVDETRIKQYLYRRGFKNI